VIYKRYCRIHKTAKIGDDSDIGTPGFGFDVVDPKAKHPKYIYPLKRKRHEYFVRIEENVEIGGHCTVDRGSWRDTIIRSGTKLDSHVKVAHNVHIGRDCLLVAGCVIGGSCTIGDGVFIGINATIIQRIRIGNGSFIGAGAVVVKDVPPGVTVKGNPAI